MDVVESIGFVDGDGGTVRREFSPTVDELAEAKKFYRSLCNSKVVQYAILTRKFYDTVNGTYWESVLGEHTK